MKTYLVTVTRQAGIGYSYIPDTYGIIADTVYQARRQAERLDAMQRPSLPELVSIRAHAVKPGETVPYTMLDWAYDWELCVRAGVTHAMQTRELADAAGAADRAAAEEDTETPETAETAETEQTERDARIADILGTVRCEIVAGYYRKKQRVTARCIREAERAGAPTVRVGYCGAQWLLSYLTPAYYTAGVYGWNCDVYTIAGLTICTGYRGMVGEPAVLTADYEQRARAAAGEDERNAILAEWIAANLDAIQAAREGARA